MKSALLTALGVVALALTLSTSHLMDGPSELEAAQAVAEAVTELEYTAIVDNGGVAFCAQFARVPHLRPDGSLICRGSLVAQGGK